MPRSSPPARRLLLVRHGQSTWNASGRWQGQADPPLSTLGARQARLAADVLGSFDVIASSPLSRAASTATIIAETLGVGPVTTDPDLMERRAGGFEGLTRPEIEVRFPGHLADGRRPAGWEADEEVGARVSGALARIAADVSEGGGGLVVTHGGVIGCLERLLEIRRDHRLPNLGGRWFEVGAGVLRGGDEILLLDPDVATVPGQI